MSHYERSQNRSVLDIQERGEEAMAVFKPLHVAGAVDEERLASFNRALGLPVPHLVILENAESPKSKAIIEAHLGSLAGRTTFAGRYYAHANLAIVDQSKSRTKAELESAVSHELAHAAKPTGYQTRRMIMRSRTPTAGFMNARNGGRFLEEGFATLVNGNRRQITDEVQSGNRMANLPPKYEQSEGYSYAALALECLGAANPMLIEPMFNSRQYPEETTKVQEEIDRVSLGLFGYLMSITYGRTNGTDHFARGLRNIQDITGIQHQDMLKITNNGPVATYVRDKIIASQL